MINTYESAAKFLGVKGDRPVKNMKATRIFRLGPDRIAVNYRGTNVVTWYENGAVEVRSGGFHTVTTRARVNEFTRERAFAAGRGRMKWAGAYFYEKATMGPDGTVQTDYSEEKQIALESRLDELRAEARKWAKYANSSYRTAREVVEEFGAFTARGITSTLVQRAGIESPRETREGY